MAQRRHPRAGTGTGGYHYYSYYGHHGGYHGAYYGHYYGHYGRYYGYGPYFSLSFGWPYYYDSYYWPGYYYPPYPYYGSPYYGYPSVGYTYAPDNQSGDPSLGPDRSGDVDRDTAAADRAPADRRDDDRDFGRLRIEVRPDDASIYVNDQFLGTARQVRVLDLPPGRHRIEVVRPGYRTEQREVQIVPGETSEVSLELQRPY
jgi:hypothetical protein